MVAMTSFDLNHRAHDFLQTTSSTPKNNRHIHDLPGLKTHLQKQSTAKLTQTCPEGHPNVFDKWRYQSGRSHRCWLCIRRLLSMEFYLA